MIHSEHHGAHRYVPGKIPTPRSPPLSWLYTMCTDDNTNINHPRITTQAVISLNKGALIYGPLKFVLLNYVVL